MELWPKAQGTSVTEMHSQSVVGLPAVFPYGLFDFDIYDLTPGGYVDITITLPQAGPTEYWHFTHHGWVQMPVISINGNVMVVRFTDGGVGDDDNAADGDIDGFGSPALDGYDTDERSHNSALGGSTTTTQPVSLPSISVQSASLAETKADTGQQVEVKALVSNQGSVKGEAALRIYVNGIQDDTLGVEVAAGQIAAVSYQFSRNEPGTYAITVNNIPAGVVIVEDTTGNTVMVLAVFTAFIIAIAAVLFVLVRRFRIVG